jgi:hypothetical protein
MTVAPALPEAVTASTRRWVERAVIGLNLCPFAKAVQAKGQVHYAVSLADDASALLADLKQQLQELQSSGAARRDTTLLIAPRAFPDFLDFNDFLDRAERLLRKLRLEGEFQIASFHPQFQFADADPGDISHYTNRSPYPILHLLREESIDRAVKAYPDAAHIYDRNMKTLRALGPAGWRALDVGPPERCPTGTEAGDTVA